VCVHVNQRRLQQHVEDQEADLIPNDVPRLPVSALSQSAEETISVVSWSGMDVWKAPISHFDKQAAKAKVPSKTASTAKSHHTALSQSLHKPPPQRLNHDQRSLSHDQRSLSHDQRSLSHDQRSLSHDQRSRRCSLAALAPPPVPFARARRERHVSFSRPATGASCYYHFSSYNYHQNYY
jgi:hypothetical protein